MTGNVIDFLAKNRLSRTGWICYIFILTIDIDRYRLEILHLCKLYKRSAFCSKMAEICGLEHGRNRDLYNLSIEKNTSPASLPNVVTSRVTVPILTQNSYRDEWWTSWDQRSPEVKGQGQGQIWKIVRNRTGSRPEVKNEVFWCWLRYLYRFGRYRL